jgi:hypothetical protein
LPNPNDRARFLGEEVDAVKVDARPDDTEAKRTRAEQLKGARL